ncbi:D-serine deaminase-like pyridoxal phosphate-dependent protein [Kitasatospora acidiphila]
MAQLTTAPTAPPVTSRTADRARYDRATAHLEAPLAIVDLAAFDANAADLVRRAGGKPIRVASKSVRCRALLDRVLAMDGFAGVMSFTLAESIWLARSGATDVLLAYPSTDRAGFAELTGDPELAARITVLVDDPAQLQLIDAARTGSEPVRVCLELDTSLRLLGGRVRVGSRRSPLHSPGQVAALAELVQRRPGFTVVGLMAYEGHIAGVGDLIAGRPVRSRLVRLMQAKAGAELADRRAAVVRAVRRVAELEFVNGGGTGSVQRTAAEAAVTEVAAGSGLYVPRLFDNYRSFRGRPAALFAQPVVRRPGVGVVTVLGGGYPASGPAGPDRLPEPYLPAGLRYDAQEAAGEVQTPLLGPAADDLLIGDRVWFRHAKAGELCERFAELHLVDGDRLVATVPTYRGEGRTFL